MFTPPPNTHPAIGKLFEVFFTPQKLETSAATIEFLKTGFQKLIPFNEIDLVASSWGEGPTVLLVHGWGGSRGQMRGFVPSLVKAGFRVVAFDFPAHGDTPGLMTNIIEMTKALEAVVAADGPTHSIIAHSFGTLASSYMLAQRPDISPSRLVYFGALNGLMDFMPRFQAMAELSDNTTMQLRLAIEGTFGAELLASIRHEKLVSTINIPVRMFHDDQDPITPLEDSLAIAQAWPTAELTITNGLGHRNALRDEKIIRRAVDFIAQSVVELSPQPA